MRAYQSMALKLRRFNAPTKVCFLFEDLKAVIEDWGLWVAANLSVGRW